MYGSTLPAQSLVLARDESMLCIVLGAQVTSTSYACALTEVLLILRSTFRREFICTLSTPAGIHLSAAGALCNAGGLLVD